MSSAALSGVRKHPSWHLADPLAELWLYVFSSPGFWQTWLTRKSARACCAFGLDVGRAQPTCSGLGLPTHGTLQWQ